MHMQVMQARSKMSLSSRNMGTMLTWLPEHLLFNAAGLAHVGPELQYLHNSNSACAYPMPALDDDITPVHLIIPQTEHFETSI